MLIRLTPNAPIASMADMSKSSKSRKSAKRLSTTAELVAGKRYRVIHNWVPPFVGTHTSIRNEVWIGFAVKGAAEPEVFIHHQHCCVEVA